MRPSSSSVPGLGLCESTTGLDETGLGNWQQPHGLERFDFYIQPSSNIKGACYYGSRRWLLRQSMLELGVAPQLHKCFAVHDRAFPLPFRQPSLTDDRHQIQTTATYRIAETVDFREHVRQRHTLPR